MFFVVADVLMDYVGADIGLLAAVSRSVGAVHVASVVLRIVDELDRRACGDHALVVVDEPLDVLREASGQRGRIAFEDRVCLSLAATAGGVCVTNDRAVRDACAAKEVASKSGLDLLLALRLADAATEAEIEKTAKKMREGNRTHVTASMLDEFLALLPRR